MEMSRGGGMADAMDSKSIDRKVMRVRLSPAAPDRNCQIRLARFGGLGNQIIGNFGRKN